MFYGELDKASLVSEQAKLTAQYQAYQAQNLKLDMSRGKPGTDQLELSMEMLNMPLSVSDFVCEGGIDARNYGFLEGIPEARRLMGDILGMPAEQIIVGGTSSLNLMYDFIAKGMTHGFSGELPWSKQGKIRFLCPCPGYDRHFMVTETFGIELVPVPMLSNGPDMDRARR